MTNLALLNNVDHQDVRIITERSAEYGDNVMFTVTFPYEFRDIQANYPILFHQDPTEGLVPIALFGFQDGENLFLGDNGWDARYVPAMIRRQPFMIGFQKSSAPGSSETARMVSLDMDHPRVSKDAGEPLFQPLGGRTPFLESMANLLEGIYHGVELNKRFVAALQEHGLIESVSMDIALNDGSRNQLLGFHAINEEKIQDLDGETLQRFSKEGFLMPLFMILASTVNIRSLVDRKNATLEA